MKTFPSIGQTVFCNAQPLSGYLQLQGDPDFIRQAVPLLGLLMVRRLISNIDLQLTFLLLQIYSKPGKLNSNVQWSSFFRRSLFCLCLPSQYSIPLSPFNIWNIIVWPGGIFSAVSHQFLQSFLKIPSPEFLISRRWKKFSL